MAAQTELHEPTLSTFHDLRQRLHRGAGYSYLWTPNTGEYYNDKETGERKESKQSVWFPVDQSVELPDGWAGSNVYFGVHPTATAGEPWQRSTNKTIIAINCLFAEVDGKDMVEPTPEQIAIEFQAITAEAQQRINAGELVRMTPEKTRWRMAHTDAQAAIFLTDIDHYNELARQHVESMTPRPSAIIHSGGGWHLYWFLTETFYLRTEADRARAKQLQAGWVGYVGGDEGAKDLARVLRPVGTFNVKPKYAPNYPVVTLHHIDYSAEYSLNELAALLPEPEEVKTLANTKERGTVNGNAGELEHSRYVYRVMGAYNERHNIVDVLLSYGYTDEGSGRLSRPGDRDSAGVSILGNKAYFHSSNDPLFEANGTHALSAFDVVVHYDYNSNCEQAAVALGRQLGIAKRERINPQQFAQDIAAAREWVRRAPAWGEHVAEWHPRREGTMQRVADAVLDLFEELGRDEGYISLSKVALRAGVGRATAIVRMDDLSPWFVEKIDRPENSDQNTAYVWKLSFCATRQGNKQCVEDSGGVSSCAKTPLTTYKAADQFNTGGNEDGRNRALEIVIGKPATDALIRLEACDKPRRDAWADYHLHVRHLDELYSVDENGQPLEPGLTMLERLPADELAKLEEHEERVIIEHGEEPQPVKLASLLAVDDWSTGLDDLVKLGIVAQSAGNACLVSGWRSLVNAQVASLGPYSLRVIDALTEIDGASNKELTAFTGLGVSAISRACNKLEARGLIESSRDGLTKRRFLSDEWIEKSFEQLPTMRTNGLWLKREIAYCDSNIKHVNKLLDDAKLMGPERERLERRRDRHVSRKLALTATEAPEVAAKPLQAEVTRAQGKSEAAAKAPMMPAPGELSYDAWCELFDLTGKELLTARQFHRLRELDEKLDAGYFDKIECEKAIERELRDAGVYGKTAERWAHYAEVAAYA